MFTAKIRDNPKLSMTIEFEMDTYDTTHHEPDLEWMSVCDCGVKHFYTSTRDGFTVVGCGVTVDNSFLGLKHYKCSGCGKEVHPETKLVYDRAKVGMLIYGEIIKKGRPLPLNIGDEIDLSYYLSDIDKGTAVIESKSCTYGYGLNTHEYSFKSNGPIEGDVYV